jgi:membrane-associated protease RseP (regulator of RpoE activity)
LRTQRPYVVSDVVLTNGERVKAKLLVDSGASHGLLLDPQSDSAITAPNETVSCVIGRGLGGEITGKVGRIKSIQLGKYILPDAIANFPDPNSYFDSLKIGRTSRNGAIGGEVLSRFSVIFDFPSETLYLKKNPSFKKDFHYNLSGMTVKAKGVRLNVFEITEVRSQSSAEKAGLRPGDVILSLNGLSNSILDLNSVNALLNAKPGKKITLQIDRNGKKLKISFRLQDII